MSTRRRKIPGLLLAFIAAFIAWSNLTSYEPAWQGKRLSEWLTELKDLDRQAPRGDIEDESASEAERRAWETNHARAVAAVRQIGDRAVPHLVRWVCSARPASSLKEKIQEFLKEHSPVKIRLPELEDRSSLALEGFEALGAAAKPAIPQLSHMLADEEIAREAAWSLCQIGPDVFPAVARVLCSKNQCAQRHALQVLITLDTRIGPPLIPVLLGVITNAGVPDRNFALVALGDLGTEARELTPWLASTMQDSNNPFAGLAMRVLAEVADAPQQYVSFFAERLAQTNYTVDAAFALARLGFEGMPPLLAALTNQNPRVCSVAALALDPELRKKAPRSETDQFNDRFSLQSDMFDSGTVPDAFTRSTNSFAVKERTRRLVSHLTACLGHPDPAVRQRVVQLLSDCRRPALLSLSHAAIDPDEAVRREAQAALGRLDVEVRDGAIVRGPKDKKRIALVFTGHEYAEGGGLILDELARYNAAASFFLTGDFLANANFLPLVQRLVKAGHLLAPHSDQHPLYCPWEGPKTTLVTRQQFRRDLAENSKKARWYDSSGAGLYYFLPPYEHYNLEIADWAKEMGMQLVNFTPGTRSTADYTGEVDTNFVSSQAIFDSIISREQQDPHGLNGFILLLHVGSGPRRTDKFHARLGELLDYLQRKGYELVTIGDLLDPPPSGKTWGRRLSLPPAVSAEAEAAAAAYARRYGLRYPPALPSWLRPTNSVRPPSTN